MEKYNLNEFLAPIWQGNTIYNETGMFYGEEGEISLIYSPDEILSIKDYGLEKTYVLGKDYLVINGKIKRTKDSSIPFATHDFLYLKNKASVEIGVEKSRCPDYVEGYDFINYSEGSYFTGKQISITYTHSDTFKGSIPLAKSDRFKNFNSKLKANQPIKIVAYGDSITTGCNASSTVAGGEVPPYCDRFDIMIKKYLERTYNASIEVRNVAVGGWAVRHGINDFDNRVTKDSADLMILAFGMNDLFTPIEKYKEQTEQMVLKFKKHNPNGEVVLVATMLPNPESDWYQNQPLFLKPLLELEEKYDYCSVADLTTIHSDILGLGKRYRDITGNNINHPNDFIVRLYAQVILKTLIG